MKSSAVTESKTLPLNEKTEKLLAQLSHVQQEELATLIFNHLLSLHVILPPALWKLIEGYYNEQIAFLILREELASNLLLKKSLLQIIKASKVVEKDKKVDETRVRAASN